MKIIGKSPSWVRRYAGHQPFQPDRDADAPEECSICRLKFVLCDGPGFQGPFGCDHPVVVSDPNEPDGCNLAHASCARAASRGR